MLMLWVWGPHLEKSLLCIQNQDSEFLAASFTPHFLFSSPRLSSEYVQAAPYQADSPHVPRTSTPLLPASAGLRCHHYLCLCG